MQTEIEVKFLAVDHNQVRAALQKAGGRLEHPMRLMRRTVFDWPDSQLEKSVDGFLRVRDEGHRVSTTYKQFNEALSMDGAKEIETIVGDYDTMVQLYKAIGMVAKSEQESKRETWRLDDCEVVLDEWPWLKPYLEIEGPDQVAIKAAAKKLGLAWKDAVSGSVTVAYRSEYDIPRKLSIAANARIAFGDPVPEWMQKVKLSK
jgi:adenylate cyclase class 2